MAPLLHTISHCELWSYITVFHTPSPPFYVFMCKGHPSYTVLSSIFFLYRLIIFGHVQPNRLSHPEVWPMQPIKPLGAVPSSSSESGHRKHHQLITNYLSYDHWSAIIIIITIHYNQ